MTEASFTVRLWDSELHLLESGPAKWVEGGRLLLQGAQMIAALNGRTSRLHYISTEEPGLRTLGVVSAASATFEGIAVALVDPIDIVNRRLDG